MNSTKIIKKNQILIDYYKSHSNFTYLSTEDMLTKKIKKSLIIWANLTTIHYL